MANIRNAKLVWVLVATVVLTVPAVHAESNAVNDFFVKSELYIWNRVADLLEIFRGGVAGGPAAGGEIAFTEKAQLGAYWTNEKGVSFPHLFPPLWVITWLDDEKVLDKHEGKYSTHVVGSDRWESTVRKTVRFDRDPSACRLQLGLGLVHLYVSASGKQAGDFVAGIVATDPLGDDQELNPNAIRKPARQLGRGMTNVLTGIFEVPYNMHQVDEDKGGVAGVTFGFARGVWRFAARETVGLLEVVTFPMGWDPIIEPEFPFEPTKSTTWKVNEPAFRKEF